MGHLGEGWLAGSLAERDDAHQRNRDYFAFPFGAD